MPIYSSVRDEFSCFHLFPFFVLFFGSGSRNHFSIGFSFGKKKQAHLSLDAHPQTLFRTSASPAGTPNHQPRPLSSSSVGFVCFWRRGGSKFRAARAAAGDRAFAFSVSSSRGHDDSGFAFSSALSLAAALSLVLSPIWLGQALRVLRARRTNGEGGSRGDVRGARDARVIVQSSAIVVSVSLSSSSFARRAVFSLVLLLLLLLSSSSIFFSFFFDPF